ncbi:MAG: hypothetical protein LCI00_13120 [Chloroflexi bacterium]|nr:hypothetical protein [Chloroflexota bacterium]
MSGDKCCNECSNAYLAKLCQLIEQLSNIAGECRKDGEKEYFYLCIEIPFIYQDEEHTIVVDINIYVDETKLQAKFEGEIFGLSTDDTEHFMENVLRIFSSGLEAFEEFNWIVSGPSDIALPMLDNLPKTVKLRIGRFEPLNDIVEFGNKFMESIIELDGFISFLLASFDDE